MLLYRGGFFIAGHCMCIAITQMLPRKKPTLKITAWAGRNAGWSCVYVSILSSRGTFTVHFMPRLGVYDSLLLFPAF